MASAAAVATGLPPKVVPCWPADSSEDVSGPKVTSAPIGNPPPRPLASVTASGTIPASPLASHLPVRPMPVWTSSRISRAPAALVASRAAFK